MNKTWYKNNKYTLSYMIIFGVILSFIFGIPLEQGLVSQLVSQRVSHLDKQKQVSVGAPTKSISKNSSSKASRVGPQQRGFREEIRQTKQVGGLSTVKLTKPVFLTKKAGVAQAVL